MYIRQAKNDSKDSFIIVQVMRFGQYSETTLSDENIVAMRKLTRFRMELVEKCGDCKRRIIALLDQVFTEYANLFSDTFGVISKELLLQCPTPENMLAVSTRKLTNLLNKASHGRFGEEKAREIRDTAVGSFGVGLPRMPLRFRYGNSLSSLRLRKHRLRNWMCRFLALKQANQVITSIHGIGNTLGAIIISEIGDINRFDAPNKLVAFVGLDVKVNQSGEFTGTKQKISKRGSPYLRRAIWLTANRTAFCDPIFLNITNPSKHVENIT